MSDLPEIYQEKSTCIVTKDFSNPLSYYEVAVGHGLIDPIRERVLLEGTTWPQRLCIDNYNSFEQIVKFIFVPLSDQKEIIWTRQKCYLTSRFLR